MRLISRHIRACSKFREIAQTEGQKSQERKRALIGKLLGPCTKGSSEAGYIFRLLQVKAAGRCLSIGAHMQRCYDLRLRPKAKGGSPPGGSKVRASPASELCSSPEPLLISSRVAWTIRM